MKKMLSISLALMMLLTAACGLAETTGAQIDLNDTNVLQLLVPAGYLLEKENVDAVLYAEILPPSPGMTGFTLSIAYADLADGPTPGEMTAEDIELAKQLVGSDFFRPDFSVMTAQGGTKFLVINENDAEADYALLIANYEGYFVQMYVSPADGADVTEADIQTALAILSSAQLAK